MTEPEKSPREILNELVANPSEYLAATRTHFASVSSAEQMEVMTGLAQTIRAAVLPSAMAGTEFTAVMPLMVTRHELTQAITDPQQKIAAQNKNVADVESVYYSVMNDKAADPLKALPVIELQRQMASALPEGDFKKAKMAWAPKFMGELADKVAKTNLAAAVPLRQRQAELAVGTLPPPASAKPSAGPA